jgi:hypothetical protein
MISKEQFCNFCLNHVPAEDAEKTVVLCIRGERGSSLYTRLFDKALERDVLICDQCQPQVVEQIKLARK